MPDRIDALTDEQTAQLQPWADRWIAMGLSTEPADFDQFEVHARACYELAGLDWPGIVVRVSSPLAAAWAVPLTAMVLGEIRSGDQVSDQVNGQVLGQVSDQVLGQVSGQVRDQVNGQVNGQVSGQVNGQVHGQVSDQVNGQVSGQVRDLASSASLWDTRWWWGWAAYSTFFRDVCKLELAKDLWPNVAAIEGAQTAAWSWWPQKNFVVVCDRPTEIHREQVEEAGWNSHRLHNPTGPAIAFRDGWSMWAINGVIATEQIVMAPETLTMADVWAETNAEVRRVMCEQIGWDRFIQMAGLTAVHEEPDPANPGHTLQLFDLPEKVYEQPVRLVLMTNASPERDGHRKRYGLTAPASCATAVGAIAWTFGVSESEYRSLARAT